LIAALETAGLEAAASGIALSDPAEGLTPFPLVRVSALLATQRIVSERLDKKGWKREARIRT
jgi:hypothetical protein